MEVATLALVLIQGAGDQCMPLTRLELEEVKKQEETMDKHMASVCR